MAQQRRVRQELGGEGDIVFHAVALSNRRAVRDFARL
jgi:hypothetical protein